VSRMMSGRTFPGEERAAVRPGWSVVRRSPVPKRTMWSEFGLSGASLVVVVEERANANVLRVLAVEVGLIVKDHAA